MLTPEFTHSALIRANQANFFSETSGATSRDTANTSHEQTAPVIVGGTTKIPNKEEPKADVCVPVDDTTSASRPPRKRAHSLAIDDAISGN